MRFSQINNSLPYLIYSSTDYCEFPAAHTCRDLRVEVGDCRFNCIRRSGRSGKIFSITTDGSALLATLVSKQGYLYAPRIHTNNYSLILHRVISGFRELRPIRMVQGQPSGPHIDVKFPNPLCHFVYHIFPVKVSNWSLQCSSDKGTVVLAKRAKAVLC